MQQKECVIFYGSLNMASSGDVGMCSMTVPVLGWAGGLMCRGRVGEGGGMWGTNEAQPHARNSNMMVSTGLGVAEHVTQVWPIRVAHASGHYNWFRDGHMTQPDPIKVNFRIFLKILSNVHHCGAVIPLRLPSPTGSLPPW